MKNYEEVKQELIGGFKELKVDGNLISQSPHFADYVRIGWWLSVGPRALLKTIPVFRNALATLDGHMTELVNKSYWKQSRAVSHFQQAEASYKKKDGGVPKDADYSKLLTRALEKFEKEHGFLVVGERLPNYAGFVFGNVFKEALAQKQHWKDVGAGETHGEYTHRLQWYVLISVGAIQTVPKNEESTVFASIAGWQKGKTNLWTFLLDRDRKEDALGGDSLDFRSPENFNLWLTGESTPEFCPVLRAFLRARMAKRGLYNLREYLAKKLKIKVTEADELITFMQLEKTQDRNASARVLFPSGEKPKFSPYVEK